MKQHAGLTCGEKPVRRDAPTGCHAGVTPGDTSHASVTFGAKTGGAKTGGAKAVDAKRTDNLRLSGESAQHR